MDRMRISTTVDGHQLTKARALFSGRDAELLDRALGALIDEIETEREIAALRASPYDRDPMLDLPLIPLPSELSYDGEVPPHVLALAIERRARREG
jgi:hypothetical protein